MVPAGKLRPRPARVRQGPRGGWGSSRSPSPTSVNKPARRPHNHANSSMPLSKCMLTYRGWPSRISGAPSPDPRRRSSWDPARAARRPSPSTGSGPWTGPILICRAVPTGPGWQSPSSSSSSIAPGWFAWTSNGAEVDLVLDRGQRRLLFEIKLSKAPRPARGFHELVEDLRPEAATVRSTPPSSSAGKSG